MQKINTDKLQGEIDFLSELMLPECFEVISSVVRNRTNYITICLENIFHSQNASALIRSSEALGIQNIHVIEDKCHFRPNVDIVKGSDKWLDIHRHNEDEASEKLIKKLKSDGYRIVATSPHVNGLTADEYDLTKGKTAIFLGTEKQGVSKTVMESADDFIRVDMHGFVESLNVSVCGAIILSSLTSQLHKNKTINWQLSPDEQLVMLNRWMKLSVRDAEKILKNRYEQIG